MAIVRSGTTMVAARLDSGLVARMDRLVAGGRAATRTELIERAVVAWADAEEDAGWQDVVDDGPRDDEGFEPSWDDDPTDWAELYADVLERS